jgi:2-polyprenyl-3-methyl-5-hydroxy-6-metoxy-1,4-benzoquinol methylase
MACMTTSRMNTDPLSDAVIVDAWHLNAAPWTHAVRAQRIESRRLVTDQAMVDAVLSRVPRTVLDIGCGEGWLARALDAAGVAVTGIDAVPALIDQARLAGGGDFRVMAYEEVAAGALEIAVDVAACNFALLGRESVDGLLAAVGRLLVPGGSFIVQTLHPLASCGELPYQDGWREGSWAGFDAGFRDPAPWYFRTLESWIRLFGDHGWQLLELREPLHPHTRKPASVIFVAQAAPRSDT